MNKLEIKLGDVVLIKAFDDVPKHKFRITDVWPDAVGGIAMEGPLKNQYGEPCYAQIEKVIR